MAIQAPEELKRLSIAELRHLSDDIRQEIVSACLRNGGHLGASLGAVELAIALHYVFESPREPILWDVGHQAYAHKLLTGRWDRFQTLRAENGISGFLRRDESPHDVFGGGHSSTALSAALAMAWARGREAGAPAWTVAVVGDGGLTSGIAFEALNMVRETPLGPLLLIINDNQMSISPNSGAVPAILARGEAREFFEHFGFDYIGPADGHDLSALIGTFRGLREAWRGKPVLLHVSTEKGKGYAPAEERPSTYHGISAIQPPPSRCPQTAGPNQGETALMAATHAKSGPSYSEAFGEALCRLAEADDRIVAITAAMTEGTGLTAFARRFPERFFDVGIAEGHATTFAAGLATQGFKPVVAIYSTFLQRAYDSVIHDVALQELGVVFAIDRAGAVGADGPTHHGAFDLGYLGLVPNLNLGATTCLSDLDRLFAQALASGKPWAIRFPRGSGPAELPGMQEPGARWFRRPEKATLLALGVGHAASRVLEAVEQLDPEGNRIAAAAIQQVKPLPPSVLEWLARNPSAACLSAEPAALRGGFGESLLSATRASQAHRHWELLGYGDHFLGQGAPERLDELEGLSTAAIARKIRALMEGARTKAASTGADSK